MGSPSGESPETQVPDQCLWSQEEWVPGERGGGRAIHPTHPPPKPLLPPSWGLPRPQEGWQLATKHLCGTVLRFPQSLKSCCCASWSPVGNCAFLQRVWSGPQVTSWCAESQVGDAGTPKQPKLPRSVFQTGQGQNLSLPFHCSTPGRATDWSCK